MQSAIQPSVVARIPIFDVDTHWAEPPDLWTSRAPQKYRDRTFQVRTKPDGSDGWFVADREVAMIGPAVVAADGSKHLNAFTLPTFTSMSRACSFAAERVNYMDSMGAGAQIVYANVIGFGAQTLMKVFPDDHALRLWHVQAYNDALVDLQKESGNRLLPQAALPLWDIEATLKEVQRIRKIGLIGIAMSDKPADFGQPSLTNPVWDRFWSTCQELNLPINFHIGSGTFEGEVKKWWHDDKTIIYPDRSLNGPISIFTAVNNFMNNFVDVINLLLSGMLEKFPTLKFVSVESGCGWMPFVIQAVEHNWKEMMSARDLKPFKRDPRQMFQEQIYATIYLENHNCVDSFVKEFGPDNLMFETDFPHPTSIYPGAREYADSVLRNWDEPTQRKILYQNAERLYGVSMPLPA